MRAGTGRTRFVTIGGAGNGASGGNSGKSMEELLAEGMARRGYTYENGGFTKGGGQAGQAASHKSMEELLVEGMEKRGYTYENGGFTRQKYMSYSDALTSAAKEADSAKARMESSLSRVKGLEEEMSRTGGPRYVQIGESGGEVPELTSAGRIMRMRSAERGLTAEQRSQLGETLKSAYEEYTGAVDTYNNSVDKYEQLSAQSGAAWDRYMRSVRDADAITPELESAKKRMEELERQLASLQAPSAPVAHAMPRDSMGMALYQQRLQEAQAAIPEVQKELEEAQREYDRLQEEMDLSTYLKWEKLRANQDFGEKSGYVPTGTVETYEIPGYVSDSGIVTPGRTGFKKNGVDIYYEYINGNPAAAEAVKSGLAQPAEFMFGEGDYLSTITDDEKALYNYVYATQGKEAAEQYLSDLKTTLTARMRAKSEEETREFTKEHPWISNIGSVLLAPAKGLSYLGQAGRALTGQEIDQNAAYNRFSYLNSAVRDETSGIIEKKWGKVGSFAYQTGMSMADFLWTTAMSGGWESLALGIMGTNAAADATIEAKDRGLSDGQAFALGTIAGLAEIATEKWSLESLLDMTSLGKNAAGYLFKNIVAEGSEEGASDIINMFADLLISQDKSQWEEQINELKAKHPDWSDEKAFEEALKLKATEVGLDMLGGAISGGVMAGGSVAFDAAGNYIAGRELTQRYGAMGAAQMAIDSGLEMGRGTDSYERAVRYRSALLGGREPSTGRTGRLVRGALFEEQQRAQTQAGESGTAATAPEQTRTENQAPTPAAPQGQTQGQARVEEGEIPDPPMTTQERETAVREREEALNVRAEELMSRGDVSDQERAELAREYEAIEREKEAIAREETREYNERRRAETTLPTAEELERRREAAGNLRELERSGRESGATEEQIGVARRIADATGRRIVFFNEGTNRHRGHYDSGTIYVNAAYGNETGQIIAHELTHSIESSGHYEEFSRLVQQRIMDAGGDLDGMLREKREIYASAGIDLDSKSGKDMKEVVAEYVERELLTSPESITSLVRENRSLGRKILDLLDSLLAKITKRDAARERAFIRRARDLYAQALQDTRSETDSEAALQQLREALAAGEITEEEFDQAYDALGIGVEERGGGQSSIAASANRQEVAGRLRSMLNSGASVEEIRRYVNSVSDTGTRQSPADTRTDGARQILRAAHESNMSVDEYLRQNWDEYEVDGQLRPEARRALEMEGGRQYSFAGVSADNADIAALARAGQLERDGENAETIRRETGWFRGIDGKWRFEIDDSGMKYNRAGDNVFRRGNPQYQELVERFSNGEKLTEAEFQELWRLDDLQADIMSMKKSEGLKLTDYVIHDELFKSYPQLRDMTITFRQLGGQKQGNYNYATNTITLDESLKGAPEDTLIHEIQHAIQKIERFTPGASQEYWSREGTRRLDKADGLANELRQEYQQRMESDETLRELKRQYESHEISEAEYTNAVDNYIENDPTYAELEHNIAQADRASMLYSTTSDLNLYQNTAGEIEARDVANRRKMNVQERRTTAPDLGGENTVFAEGSETGWSKVDDSETSTIKEQIAENRDRLNSMDIVGSAIVPTDFKHKDDAVNWAIRLLNKTGFKVDRQGYGTIIFSKNYIDLGMRYADTPAEKAAIVLLPKVLKRGIEIGKHDAHKARSKKTITFGAPVELNGIRGNMAVVINRHGDTYYAHRIVLPDGSTFVFPNKNDTAQELSQGVTVSGSLAKTTSAASKNNVSQRGGNVKTQFSIAAPVERTDTLIAVHNMDEEKLRRTLALGAWPSPSIAVVEAEQGHDMYGDYSAVFPRSTVDPEADSRNRVYGSDAWTPTHDNARVEYEVNYDRLRQIEDRIHELSRNVAGGIFANGSVLRSSGIEDVTTDDLNAVARKLSTKDAVKAAYLADRGVTVDPEQRAKEYDRAGNEFLQDVIDALGVQELATAMVRLETGERLDDGTISVLRGLYRDMQVERLTEGSGKRRTAEEIQKRAEMFANSLKEARLEDFVRHSWEMYQEGGGKTEEIDRAATRDKLTEAAPDKDVEAWVKGQIEGLLGEPGIYNGEDPYDSKGNRKSFSRLHWPVSAENIVRAMNSTDARGANMMGYGGAEGLLATASPEYRSVREMHADEGRLGQISQDEYRQKIDELDRELEGVIRDITRTTVHHSDNTYEEQSIISYTISEAASTDRSQNAIRRTFLREGYTITPTQARAVAELLKHAAQMPTGYFEAKPQRVVSFDEAVAVAAPDNAPENLLEELRSAGMNVVTYKAGDRQSRIDVLNSLEGARFSIARQDTDSDGRKLMRVNTDANGNLVLPENVSYRGAKADSPMSDYGSAMFADDPDNWIGIRNRVLSGNKGTYAVRHEVLTDINELKEQIAEKWDEDRSEGFAYAPMITSDYLEDVSGEEIAELFDPNDIVDSAGAYDNDELIQWFYDRVIEPADIAGIKTSDGAVVFDDSVIERVVMDQGNREGAQFSVSQEGERADIRDTIPAKARGYLERVERGLVNKVGALLQVPRFAQREYLRDISQKMSREYLTEGSVSQETRDKLFEEAYSRGVEVDREFYEQYKDLKKRLREKPITISNADFSDVRGFSDFEEFRKAAFGTLRIVKEGATPVDTAYQELSAAYPDLFPEDITHPGDQIVRMYEVGRSIAISERTLDKVLGPRAEEYKSWMRNDFEAAVGDMIAELRTVKRYTEDRVTSTNAPETTLTLEEIKELYPKARDARKNYEKVSTRNLLTAEDQRQVGRLMRGDIELSDLKAERDNVRGITEVFEAKQEYEKYASQIREWNETRKAQLRDEADEYLYTANAWHDKSKGILYSRETMERNVRDIVKDRNLADRIVKKYFTPVHEAAAKSTKLKNTMRDRVRALDLSRKVARGNKVSEAHAVQLLGEAMDNIDYLQKARHMKERDGKSLSDWRGVVQELHETNSNMDWRKVERAIEEFRKIYDELFEMMNDSRVKNGYEPVAYRKGYFPHFQPGESDGVIALFGKALGISTDVTALPTTINGLTHTFRPGIQWFGNALERTGFDTAYDAVEGFDKYIEGVADVIFQTENIQRLRALSSQMRYRTSNEGLRKQVDEVRADKTLSERDKENRIKEIYDSGRFTLGNFVVELEEYTNLLANKKSRADRNLEQAIGRKWYNLVKTLEGRVAANMVAVNPGSWLTNFIPLTQGGAMLDRGMLLHGMWDTMKATTGKFNDDIVSSSVFLTNRRGSDPLVRTWQQKASATMSKPMEWIDNFTADSLVRARYRQNVQNRHMSEAAAMEEADNWVAGVMADRSKGSTPTLFNRSNPLTKLFTQFQLEVNNQLSYVYKDMPRGLKEKGLGALALALFKFALGAWLYDEVYEYFIGRRPALDPIGMLNDTVGDLTGWELPNMLSLVAGAFTGDMPSFETEKVGVGGAISNLGENVAEELPFVGGLLGGGRLPISSALPNVGNLLNAATNSDWSAKKRWETAVKELANPLTYLVLPFGGGQMKKILQGVGAVVKGGSFTVDSEGRDIMQYPVYNDSGWGTAWNAFQGTLFGKSSFPGAQRWVESGFKNYSAKATGAYQGLVAAGIRGRDADNIVLALTGAKKTEEKSKRQVQIDILRSAAIPEDLKIIPYYALIASDSEISLIDDLAGGDASELLSVLMGVRDADALSEGSTQEKRNVLFSSTLTDDEIIAVYRSQISADYALRLQKAQEYGISMRDYYNAAFAPKDRNGDGRITQDEITQAIRSMNLTRDQKAVLWQLATGSSSPGKNPFGSRKGQEIYDWLQKEKEREETGEEQQKSGAHWENGRLVLPKYGESRVLPRG